MSVWPAEPAAFFGSIGATIGALVLLVARARARADHS